MESHLVVEALAAGDWESSLCFAARQQFLNALSRWHRASAGMPALLGARIHPVPHQLYAARWVLGDEWPRHLLADEVGLGKTIEAGLAVQALRGFRGQLRILVVEDNRVNQLLAKKLLERMGYRISQAINGREAVNMVKDQVYDLILMDIQMPEMDGFDATRAIRLAEAGREQHLPIVAMTAHAMKGDQERCLASGMDNYITKPIKREQLENVIRKYLD